MEIDNLKEIFIQSDSLYKRSFRGQTIDVGFGDPSVLTGWAKSSVFSDLGQPHKEWAHQEDTGVQLEYAWKDGVLGVRTLHWGNVEEIRFFECEEKPVFALEVEEVVVKKETTTKVFALIVDGKEIKRGPRTALQDDFDSFCDSDAEDVKIEEVKE